MQPKFESQFERTFDIEQELYRYMHLTSPPMIASLVILGVIFVVNLVMMLFVGMLYANMAVFAMCVMVLFVLLLRYYLAVQAAKKRFAEDTNNNIESKYDENNKEICKEDLAFEALGPGI